MDEWEEVPQNNKYDGLSLRHACWDMEKRITVLEQKVKDMEYSIYQASEGGDEDVRRV